MKQNDNIVKRIIKIFFVSITLFIFSINTIFAFNPNNPITVLSSSDPGGRNKISIANIRNSNYINFYVEQDWWNSQSQANRSKVENFVNILSSEFEHNMYPKIKTVLPDAANQINFNKKIEMVITPMVGSSQGYIKQEDFYDKSDYKNSNEGNVIYFNAQNIIKGFMPNNVLFSFFAHEVMHILSFQEKAVKRGIFEDTWLEEVRSEFLPHFLGYNNGTDSYINFRLKEGTNISEANIINWENTSTSYSLAALFGVYLEQRYTKDIIFETLKTHLTGIDSINYYLIKNGHKERFDEIYQDWTIAVALNDCNVNQKYCYKNLNVKIGIPGSTFFLPVNSDSVLSISDVSLRYQAKYQRIIGGSDTLEITFENPKTNQYRKVPILFKTIDGTKKLDFFIFNGNQESKIVIKDYKKNYTDMMIVPVFSNGQNDSSQLFKWNVNSINASSSPSTTVPSSTSNTQGKNDLIMKLQLQLIELLKQLLIILKQQRGI